MRGIITDEFGGGMPGKGDFESALGTERRHDPKSRSGSEVYFAAAVSILGLP